MGKHAKLKEKQKWSEEKLHLENARKLRGMAREMGSPRQVPNRRRRTREGPEPACVLSPFRAGWHTQGGKDELTSCRGTV